MVVEEKTTTWSLLRYRIGMVLIWFGVLTWLPFIVMRTNGSKPSLFWFLPFHLVGVVGGSRLRKKARAEMGAESPKKNTFRTIGHTMIFLGILVWGVYFYQKLVVAQLVDVGDFLPYHLTGIFGGIFFLIVGYFRNRRTTASDC